MLSQLYRPVHGVAIPSELVVEIVVSSISSALDSSTALGFVFVDEASQHLLHLLP